MLNKLCDRLFLVLLVPSLLASPTLAMATSVLQVTLLQHLQDSEAVVEVRVLGSEIVTDDVSGRPVTDTTVEVQQILWGDTEPTLAVRQLKSNLADYSYGIAGDGQLSEGTHLILFLHRDAGRWYLANLGQSVFEVKGDGPKAALEQQLDGLIFFERDERGAIQPSQPRSTSWTLSGLEAAIRSVKEAR